MKKSVTRWLSAVCILISGTLCAQNLVKNSEFNTYKDKAGPEFRSNGGKFTLFTEDRTWNRCGKLEVTKLQTRNGITTASANVWAGGKYDSNDKPGGFVCKPGTTYEFSVDIKGTAQRAGILFTQWHARLPLWHGKSSRLITGIKVSDKWTNFKGSFTTAPDTVSAALAISLWDQAKTERLKTKVGDYLLIDNLVIRERKRPALNKANGSAAKVSLDIRKIIPADGTVYSDFHRFRKDGDLTAKTSFKVERASDALVITIDCEEPLKVTPAAGDNGKVWSGDTVELFFGAKKNDRDFSQFAVSANGKTYTSMVNGENLKWDVKTEIKDKGWSAVARIPYASLGWDKPADGESILFNLARQRLAAKEYASWSKVAVGFSELKYFGKIYLGKIPGGVTRAAFERSEAQKIADALQAKLDFFRTAKFLCAPVNITDDFSVPYMPDALFNKLDKIELAAAVNEIKPLPFAIYNNTDKTAVYRVTVELPREKAFDWHDGELFPGVTYYEALRIRDNVKGTSAIYDALSEMNKVRTVTVPAGECTLVWFDFNTKDLKPGKYNARIRIIPLTGAGEFSKRGYGHGNLNYRGDMKDIPLEFTIYDFALAEDPLMVANYFAEPINPEAIKLGGDAGMRICALNTWGFRFPLKDGKFELTAPIALQRIKRVKACGYNRFWVGYSAAHVFVQLYGKKNMKYFGEWVKAIEQFLIKNDVRPEECFIEIYDEPPPGKMAEIIENLKAARGAVTRLKISMTLGARIMSPQNMELMAPYVDDWVLWRSGYFSDPGHLKFIREQQKKGVTFGHYTCATSIRASLDKNFRRNAWFGAYQNLDYNNMYQGNSNLANNAWKSNGGEALLYINGSGAVPSIRFMAVRQGMTDVKYLDKLKTGFKDSAEAQAFLKTAAKRVVVDFAHDPATADKVRSEAAQLILKLQKKR